MAVTGGDRHTFSVELVASSAVRARIEASGGSLYIWPRAIRCCGGRQFVLEAAFAPPADTFELMSAADGCRVYASSGLVEPEELHVEVDPKGRPRAYWNDQGWIG